MNETLSTGNRGADLSFLAPPESLADWRMVLAYAAAANSGILDALPGTLAELAGRFALDEGALRAVLGQLVACGIVAEDDDEHYGSGPRAPVPPDDARLLVHAAVIQRWAALLGRRLRDRTAGSAEFPVRPIPTGVGADLLALNARRLSRSMVDVCLQHFPHARRYSTWAGATASTPSNSRGAD